jgi:WD40 repeat protein
VGPRDESRVETVRGTRGDRYGLWILARRQASVASWTYSPDATGVLAAYADQTVRQWDRTSGRELEPFKGHTRLVTACKYSADSTRVLSASWDRTVREWDRATAEELRRFEGHTDFVTACAYSANGKFLLSASEDSTIRIWARDTARCVATVYGAAPFEWITTAPRSIAAGDDLGNLWLLDCDWL